MRRVLRNYTVKLESGYRSKLEERIGEQLEANGVKFEYETLKVPYVVPERDAYYLPDFILPNGIILEGKGRFEEAKDRQKMIHVKEQNPHLDIRFIFERASTKIYPGSKTTYAMWAESHGFPWAEKKVPTEWIREAQNAASNRKPSKSSST